MFTLEQVVPWGRSYDEYRAMFALGDHDMRGRVLDCGGGPASFAAEAARRGECVVSCDPLYVFDASQIAGRISETYDTIIHETERNAHEFVWTLIRSVDELGRRRLAAMDEFRRDLAGMRANNRYVAGTLPDLPFADGSFDLAVCSHLLFLYTRQLSAPFHVESATEMCRVAREVRIFPLLALGGQPSAHAPLVAETLGRRGYRASIETVPYEFQRGGNQMMRITR